MDGAQPEQLPPFGELLIYGAVCLPVFLLTCLHSVCLLLVEARLSASEVVGGRGVQVLCVV